jgi:hypothetical protein
MTTTASNEDRVVAIAVDMLAGKGWFEDEHPARSRPVRRPPTGGPGRPEQHRPVLSDAVDVDARTPHVDGASGAKRPSRVELDQHIAA